MSNKFSAFLIALIVILFCFGAVSADVSAPVLWKKVSTYILPQNATWGLRVPALVSCNTIDTDADGKMSCGTDEGGAGSMSWPSSAGLANYSGSSSWGTSLALGTLTDGKACSYASSGNTLSCTATIPSVGTLSALTAGTLTNGKGCSYASSGTSISCDTTYLTAESDPKVGTLTNTKWCTSNGSVVACTSDAPVLSESDPKVGTLTSGNFCKGTGTQVSCTDSSAYLTSLSGAVLTDQTSGQTIGATGARLTKLWATDITVSNAISGSVTGNAGTVTNATFTTALTNNGGAGTLAWPAGGATLTIPTGGGTLGTAAFTAATAYLASNGKAADADLLDNHDTSYFQTALTYPVTGVASPTAGYLTKWGVSGNAIVDGPKLGTLTDTKWCSFSTAGGLACTENAPAGTGDVTDVGDCTGGNCLDGTSDGGTYIKFYDAQGATQLIGGDTAGAAVLTLPITTGTLALTSGNVATATALAADPADCGAGTVATSINASGTLTCGITPLVAASIDTSAEIATIVGDETGSGALVFGTSPTFTTSIAFNADPADTGAIRLSNGDYIWSESSPTNTDVSVLGVDSSEIIQIGASGASGVTITPDLTITGDGLISGSDLSIGAAGVKLTGDGDGAITFLGLGNGFDEDFTMNLDDVSNTLTLSSSTGLATIDFGTMALDIDEGKLTDSTVVSADIKDGTITAADTALTAGRSLTLTTNDFAADAETYTDTKCYRLSNSTGIPNTRDDKSLWMAKNAFTLTSVWAESDQTVNFSLQVDDGTPADVDSADMAPAAGTAEDTALNGDATMGAGDRLDLDITSVANTPTWLTICWTGTWDD